MGRGNVASRKPNRRRVVVPGVVRALEDKLKRKLRSKACSEPWVEAQVRYVPCEDKDGNPFAVGEYAKGVYPVRGMVQCRGCERWTPPNYVGSQGYCYDCQLGAMSPMQLSKLQGSTSTINLAKVKAAIRRGATVVSNGI